MSISEKDFERTIEEVLVQGTSIPAGVREASILDDAGGVDDALGGYRKRVSADYDRALCLIPEDVLGFIVATQPQEWERFKQQLGSEARTKLLQRVAQVVRTRGTLEVLRRGVKANGCSFKLAYFRPASSLNPDTQRLHAANIFSVIRQLHYSEKNDRSLDLALFLNGLPLFTAELKNPFNGQNVQDAIKQYRRDRDPRESLFAANRCLGHFAVDPNLVYVTTRLAARETRFLPFNQGNGTGAGNPPAWRTFATAYLWEQIWSRESVLNLVEHFIHETQDEDDRGQPVGPKRLIFPRYHQLDAVRRLVIDARATGPGKRYLIQHSAGSGKSNSIAWLAHQLSSLHDALDQRVFDSIIVVTDRRVLDRQLQRTIRQFEQTLGVVENIDQSSKQLKTALEEGKNIVVTTLQKFPVIVNEIGTLPGSRFAVIIDEAHSSQSGESTKHLKTVLSGARLDDAERQDHDDEQDYEDRIAAEMTRRGRLSNVSFFAFTATPKPKTLELFGTEQSDGAFTPFSLYSMRQAIEEGFILDVLENYTTYTTYFNLLKKVEDDPSYDRDKAIYLLRSFVDLHEHAISQKVAIMVDHFVEKSSPRIEGRAKAMIVTRSRLHAVRYKLAVDKYLRERGYTFRSLVAFSGTVRDGGIDYTESGMNGFPETQTAETFKRDEYRLLIVANKFQTGFDQPLLHTMYVDKKLGGVNAVQTLSRLNRVHPGKTETMVLDFANDAEEIQQAFQPYYERTFLTEATDPNLLHDLELQLSDFALYERDDVELFARHYFIAIPQQHKLYAAVALVVDRFKALPMEARAAFRSALAEYVRLYAFLSQIIPFSDADLEKLYAFGRYLLRVLPVETARLPVEIQQAIDMESYRIQQRFDGAIELERGPGGIDPKAVVGPAAHGPDELERLSLIIEELNERFGTAFTKEDRVFIEQLESKLAEDQTLDMAVRVNTPENVRLVFADVANRHIQDMVDSNFRFYKQITDDRDFGLHFLGLLFERFYERKEVG